MTADRKKPGVTFWATVVAASGGLLPALYVASYGPALWLLDHAGLSDGAIDAVYWFYAPLDWVSSGSGPDPFHDWLNWYIDLWVDW